MRSFHITPLGWVVLLLLPIALIAFLLGPASLQVPALVVALLVLLFVCANTFSARRGPDLNAVRDATAEFHPRAGAGQIEQEVDDPDAWRRERERREQHEREQASTTASERDSGLAG